MCREYLVSSSALPPPLPPKRKKGWVLAIIVPGMVLAAIVSIGVMAVFVAPSLGALNDSAKAELERRQARAKREAAPQPKPLSARERRALRGFGREVEEALNAGDTARLAHCEDADALADRVFDGLPEAVPARARHRAAFQEKGGWLEALGIAGLKAKFLREREREGLPAVLLRLQKEDEQVAYVDLMVRPAGNGFRVVDVYTYLNGSTVSREERKLRALEMSHGEDLSQLGEIFELPGIDATALVRLEILQAAINRKQWQDVLRICDRLPLAVQKQKPFFLPRLCALRELGQEGGEEIGPQYVAALRVAPAILGKDSTSDLQLKDELLALKDCQGADECLQRVDAVVGGDPYLKVLRAECRLWLGDDTGALALADQAQEEDGTLLKQASALRLAVHLTRRDHAATVRELRGDGAGKPLDRQQLAGNPEYRELLASPEFIAWEKEAAQKP